MPRHEGVVTVDEEEIPVIIELDNEAIRLTAAGKEVGNWRPDECEIIQIADATYTIEAENEVLQFVPHQPQTFAAALNGENTTASPSEEAPTDDAQTDHALEETGVDLQDAPAPQPLTVGLFYGLCFLTAALAIWSLISIIS